MTQEREAKRGGGRPREIKPERNADGSFSVRLTLEREGETVRKRIHLGTSDRAVAKKRAEQIAEGTSPHDAFHQKKGVTFLEVAERVMAESAIRTKKDRVSRLRRYAYPLLGEMQPNEIKVGDIRACLSLMEDQLGWTRSIRHLKDDISSILGQLYSDGELDENAAKRIDFKKLKPIRRVTRLRLVLTDVEFSRFIEHGLSLSEDGALPELHMLALASRCLGGMRTSDLHAWRWEHIGLEQWRTARVPRPKTMGGAETFDTSDAGEGGEHVLEPYELPSEFAKYLYLWWQKMGSPSEGPIFPVRQGRRAGQHKGKVGYSRQLRDALWEAGVIRPLPGYEKAPKEERWRFCALQSGIEGKRAPVDFHSFRRAFVQGTLGETGEGKLTFVESMRLADHSSPQVHMRYLVDGNRRVIPEGALPRLPALARAPELPS